MRLIKYIPVFIRQLKYCKTSLTMVSIDFYWILSLLFRLLKHEFKTFWYMWFCVWGFGTLYLGYQFIRKYTQWYRKASSRKAILITGSSSGLGLELVKHYYKLGFSVIGTHRSSSSTDSSEIEKLVKKSAEASDGSSRKARVYLLDLDVRSRESISHANLEVEQILQENKLELYGLINNAGVSVDGPAEWTSPDAIQLTLDTNILGTALVTRQFISKIIKSKGRVINLSSGLHPIPFSSWPVYTSSKSAITRYSESLDMSLRQQGAACCCAMPGVCLSATDLIYKKYKQSERSKSELNNEELSLYSNSIKSYTSSLNRLLGKTFEINGRNMVEIMKKHDISIPKSVLDAVEEKRKEGETKLLDKLVVLAAGGAQGKVTEYFFSAFDEAMLAENPRSHVYPGSFVYTNYIGPWMDLLPHEVLYRIGLFVFNTAIS